MHALTCFYAKRRTTITHAPARDCPDSRLAPLDPEAGTGSEQGSQPRKASHWLITSAHRPFCRQSERADMATCRRHVSLSLDRTANVIDNNIR